MTTIEPIPQQRTFGELGFDAFYRHNLSIVYGYVLRLCGGSVDRAQDLTQEAWTAFVDQVRAGRADQLDVRWLIAVARNRYIDQWRRTRKLEIKLGLVWNATRDCDNDDAVTRAQVLEQLNELEDDHRIVLMMRYIDGLPVDEIATAISRTVTATYSLLARARDELRRRIAGPVAGGLA
jgi:RNA polymerase sigma-70 factor (ECF subfamily)